MARRHGRKSSGTLPPLPSLLDMPPPTVRLLNGTAFKAEWADPDDIRPNASRTARTITGYMSFCPLRWCLRRHKDRSSFNREHIEGADRLRLAFDGSRLGFSALKDWRPVHSILYRPLTGPTQTAMRQLKCRKQFDQVWSLFCEADRVLLALVVLHNTPIGRAAETLGQPKPRVTQALVTALDKLVEHYDLKDDRAAA